MKILNFDSCPVKVLAFPIRYHQLVMSGSGGIDTRTLRTWPLSPCIEAREEIWTLVGDPTDKGTKLVAVYNQDGAYVGDLSTGKWLLGQGIRPEPIDSTRNVCSVGYSRVKNQWFGWSHRAICGFVIGDMLFDAEDGADKYGFLADPRPFTERGSVRIENMEQARQAACNFAEYVS